MKQLEMSSWDPATPQYKSHELCSIDNVTVICRGRNKLGPLVEVQIELNGKIDGERIVGQIADTTFVRLSDGCSYAHRHQGTLSIILLPGGKLEADFSAGTATLASKAACGNHAVPEHYSTPGGKLVGTWRVVE